MKQIDRIRNMNAVEVAKIIRDIAHNYLFDTMLGNKELDLVEWLESESDKE